MTDQIRISDRLSFKVFPCPAKYLGPLIDIGQDDLKRVFFYVDGQQFMLWDIYLTDDTRYEANLEVAPSFRQSNWMELLLTADKGSLEVFSRPNCVWANSGTIIIEQEEALVNFHRQMTEREIMKTHIIYAHGSLNKIIRL